MALVDVKDVARAQMLVYKNNHASGQYFCIASVVNRIEFVEMLSEMFQEYPIGTRESFNFKILS